MWSLLAELFSNLKIVSVVSISRFDLTRFLVLYHAYTSSDHLSYPRVCRWGKLGKFVINLTLGRVGCFIPLSLTYNYIPINQIAVNLKIQEKIFLYIKNYPSTEYYTCFCFMS